MNAPSSSLSPAALSSSAPAVPAPNVAAATLPPGSKGLPVAGETLGFLRDPFGFYAARRARHGRVFRTRILGRNVAVVSGPAAVTAFLDRENVTREGAHPAQVRTLFGGVNMNMFDGAAHFALKSLALEAFDRTALAAYLPDLERLVRATLARSSGREVRGVEVFRRLAMEGIALNVLGLAPGTDSDRLREDYGEVIRGLLALPLPIPGTRFGRALKARARIFALFRRLIRDRRRSLEQAPPEAPCDGLGRMLRARFEAGDGSVRAFQDDELLLELHHIMMAGYIVFGLFVELVRRLDEAPELAARARRELTAVLGAARPDDPAPVGLGPSLLRQLPFLEQLVREAKRTAPILPVVFGKARRDFVCEGHRIPAGWDVHLALSLCNDDPGVFTSPGTFDPDRYAEPRREHERHAHAFVPQGAGPATGHRCLGHDYATVFGQVFLAVLLEGYDFERHAPASAYDTALLPQEPRDGQRLTLTARGRAPASRS